jgi:Icc protein
MPKLHFAHITDIHISEMGDHHDLLSGRAVDFLTHAIETLNQIPDLEFALITGDLFDTASQWELSQFQQTIELLNRPYYVVPGNHDRRDLEAAAGLTRDEFAQIFNPQVQQRPNDLFAQKGYWSQQVGAGVQLIGLDSVKPDDWGGVIDERQLSWLRQELRQHSDKVVLVAVHHPLHQLSLIDQDTYFHRFVGDNGAAVIELLNEYPQVKGVFTGHHHLSRVDTINGRLHVAGPSLTIFPCAFRTIWLEFGTGDRVHIRWRSHSVTDETTLSEAQQRTHLVWAQAEVEPEIVASFVKAIPGSDFDRDGRVTL